MLTEEWGLNPYLEARGIDVVDTDLGERIVQLRGETPSHIVLPAILAKTAARLDVGGPVKVRATLGATSVSIVFTVTAT